MSIRKFYNVLTESRRTAAKMMLRKRGASEREICLRLKLRSFAGTIRELRDIASTFGIASEVIKVKDKRTRYRLIPPAKAEDRDAKRKRERKAEPSSPSVTQEKVDEIRAGVESGPRPRRRARAARSASIPARRSA